MVEALSKIEEVESLWEDEAERDASARHRPLAHRTTLESLRYPGLSRIKGRRSTDPLVP